MVRCLQQYSAIDIQYIVYVLNIQSNWFYSIKKIDENITDFLLKNIMYAIHLGAATGHRSRRGLEKLERYKFP